MARQLQQMLLLLLLPLLEPQLVAAAALPSILFIVVDDLGSNDVAAWATMQANDPQIPTPHLDRLIGEGVSLRSYYVLPVCSPSRTSLLSGKYPMHLGTQHQVLWAGQRAGLPLEEETIADHLSAQGYATHAIGKVRVIW
jgi:arylsulfatase B/arylsulfatase I/J